MILACREAPCQVDTIILNSSPSLFSTIMRVASAIYTTFTSTIGKCLKVIYWCVFPEYTVAYIMQNACGYDSPHKASLLATNQLAATTA